ncbi:helix-turn-helix domain-containing protein [Candidatus Gracilibacteria bacterium]|nr:helix-turn-helix domain-containing protein [Candidatus Gracilibacteria bacterium]NUJ98652.1 helix-turn-helix domain-containing protein [Candidatus Gracilibacteria bacterium]
MYKLTRQEAADVLNISTRSVDRYIKAGKLRSKKDGKIIYINNNDIESMKNNGLNQEVIIPIKVDKEDREEIIQTKAIQQEKQSEKILTTIYEDLRQEIQKKDDIIQTLSLRLGKAEEIAKNSISLMDFKKSQFLLEESKGYLSGEVENLKKEKSKLAKELKYEKNTNNIMIIFLVLLLILTAVIWFMKIG